jgi:phosphatidylserine/phosphatidylglycerophosphate/cardiolipin synthase-like enzyme
MAMVDGGAARALAGIARDRWRRSTGTSIPDSVQYRDLWPDSVTPDLVDVSIGISRTDFDTNGSGGCREIEELHLNLIAAAREFIYIENQYLTSATIVNALCRRLETADGPEVIIVLPLNNTGWLEEHTIEVMRLRSVRLLRQADRFDRLRITYPVVPDLADTAIGVHAKVLIADDRLLRVGSSNLTNRSMRLDTECDLTIEAAGPSERLAISGLRNRLLAEHLGMSSEAIVSFLAKDASLVRLVDSRRASARCLLDLPVDDRLSEPIVEDELVDPSEPITTGLVLEALATSSTHRLVKRVLPLAVICVAMTAVAVLCWRTIRARSRPLRR